MKKCFENNHSDNKTIQKLSKKTIALLNITNAILIVCLFPEKTKNSKTQNKT